MQAYTVWDIVKFWAHVTFHTLIYAFVRCARKERLRLRWIRWKFFSRFLLTRVTTRNIVNATRVDWCESTNVITVITVIAENERYRNTWSQRLTIITKKVQRRLLEVGAVWSRAHTLPYRHRGAVLSRTQWREFLQVKRIRDARKEFLWRFYAPNVGANTSLHLTRGVARRDQTRSDEHGWGKMSSTGRGEDEEEVSFALYYSRLDIADLRANAANFSCATSLPRPKLCVATHISARGITRRRQHSHHLTTRTRHLLLCVRAYVHAHTCAHQASSCVPWHYKLELRFSSSRTRVRVWTSKVAHVEKCRTIEEKR